MLSSFLENLLIDSANIIKLGLENTKNAANLLNLKKPAPYVVMVAGTNGKGSVITLLESLLVNLGFRTGCYTSPHLINFNERIRINAKPVDDKDILQVFEQTKKAIDEHNKHNINKADLTFFEFITIGAWKLYQDCNLDILLLEVGLGGRLDAVNVIEKDLAIITSVDFDHQNILGNTLDDIGYQKAGIIAANKPVILGDKIMPQSVIDEAKLQKAKIFQYGIDYTLRETSDDYIFTQNSAMNFAGLKLEKRAYHNIKYSNIATSLQALDIIIQQSQLKTKNKLISELHYDYLEVINKTVKNFNLLGRCSWLDNEKTLLIDVAHNCQSISNLNDYLLNLQTSLQHERGENYQVIALFGMLKDKDIKSCIEIIEPRITQWLLVSINQQRGAAASYLSRLLLDVNPQARYFSYDNLEQASQEAYRFLRQNNNKKSILVVFGSFHVVGPFYSFYKNKYKSIAYGH